MIEISALLDLISDRQLQEYVIWLTNHPDSNEEESIAYLMDILNDSQVDILLEKDFNATPYSSWYGACITSDGRCFESTMSDCRVLGGQFQGPGTSCGGYQKPRLMHSEDNKPECCELYWNGRDEEWLNVLPCEDCEEMWWGTHFLKHPHFESARQEYKNKYGEYEWAEQALEEKPWKKSNASKSIAFNAPEGKVFHDPAAALDPRLKNDHPPKSVTNYLRQHPEVANLYDDDDASVLIKGIVLGCLIGALGTIFGNLASEMIMDKWKINPQFIWDK